jgi:hypothetical protein
MEIVAEVMDNPPPCMCSVRNRPKDREEPDIQDPHGIEMVRQHGRAGW